MLTSRHMSAVTSGRAHGSGGGETRRNAGRRTTDRPPRGGRNPTPEGGKTIRRPSFHQAGACPPGTALLNPGPRSQAPPELPEPDLVPFSCSTITASSESLIFIKSSVRIPS
jgi:hypothetical protein